MAPCAGMARGVSSIVSDPVVFLGGLRGNRWCGVVCGPRESDGLRLTRATRGNGASASGNGGAAGRETRRASEGADAPCRGRGRAAGDGRLGDRPFSVFLRDQAARFPRPDGRRVRGVTDVCFSLAITTVPPCPMLSTWFTGFAATNVTVGYLARRRGPGNMASTNRASRKSHSTSIRPISSGYTGLAV
uniref:Uncharacterized protein n=1 Tax=Oryza meridionalis TaxID=40149 RepID=A0A0E0DGQ9_9ORYZ